MKNDKILALINALNDIKDVQLEDGLLHVNEIVDGKIVDRYAIKKRPVADADGVEKWSFVARQSSAL